MMDEVTVIDERWYAVDQPLSVTDVLRLALELGPSLQVGTRVTAIGIRLESPVRSAVSAGGGSVGTAHTNHLRKGLDHE